MIEMIPIKIDHEVVEVGGSIPLDDLFVEKEAGEGADYAHPYDRNDPDDLGVLNPLVGLFVIEEGTRNKKSSFYLYTELESILLGCFLHFLLIAI